MISFFDGDYRKGGNIFFFLFPPCLPNLFLLNMVFCSKESSVKCIGHLRVIPDFCKFTYSRECHCTGTPSKLLNKIYLISHFVVFRHELGQVESFSKRSSGFLTHYQTTEVLDWSKLKRIADGILKCI